MDRFSDPKFDKQIYEIYKACRLCGGGAGYKMPIVQNVVDLEGRDVELKQKIRECVQIEVSQGDKMPPLICELCVDKVNDFYEFLDMCRQTNKRTRQKLGLPQQALARESSETADCILGITEPVFVKDDQDEPASKNKSKVKGKVKKEDVKIKVEPETVKDKQSGQSSSITKRKTRHSRPSPPPIGRRKTDAQQQGKKTSAPLKSILKKDVKVEIEPPRPKRVREKEVHPELPAKRVKIAAKPDTKPKIRRPSPKPSPKPNTVRKPPMHACNVCGAEFKTVQALASHVRTHPKKLATNNKTNASKTQKNNHCPPKETKSPPSTPREFKCDKCERVYTTPRSLVRHQNSCTTKEKVSQAAIDPAILRSLRRVQIRVARCDSLLSSRDSCLITNVEKDYGLDSNCVYPYITSVRSLRIKKEPVTHDGMVAIGEEIKRQFENEVFIHWDSDDSSESDQDMNSESKTPEPLSRLALKIIYSERYLGKVPRKRRRIKLESIRSSVEKFDDDNSDNIGNKVASFDDLLRDDNENDEKIHENDKADKIEDFVMDDGKDLSESEDGLDKDMTKISTNSDSSQSDINSAECNDKEANVGETVDSNIYKSKENNILKDNISIVNNEDEVASKSSLSVSEEDRRETDETQLESKEVEDAEENMSQESDSKDKVDEQEENIKEVNEEIAHSDNIAQNAEKLEEDTSNETEDDAENAAKNEHSNSNSVTDDKENGITNKDEGDSRTQNDEETGKEHQEMENDNQETTKNDDQKLEECQTEECDLKNGNTTDICSIVNGIANSKDEESKPEVSDMELGLENIITGKEENTEENRLLNGEFSDEMDRKLMEELDAQIGECEGDGDSACERDKITLADLLPDKAHERLDLDSIADEFNFDP